MKKDPPVSKADFADGVVVEPKSPQPRQQKNSHTPALELYEKDEPKPKVGTYSIVLDGSGAPVCITQTERVEIKNFNKVTADHAYLEGEGNRSLKYWRKGHKDFFEKEYYQAGKVFTDEIPCICETFKVVHK
ncbi:ASCH domain-containing protein [Furfurilactobacillus siliginis]|uniref:ASCH domain-containing protein n=1 Tax=Furfurilactobacillus siliginis TaxID=348151 RepID=A0A510VUQ2_9LACO|nr:ASCH domain-containing protein [Furfurilactobacillus siliginis]GEK28705.1 hypothetical protein LSI01_10160 [Furfurilactobacillus siliginis]